MTQTNIFDFIEGQRLKEIGIDAAANGYGASEWVYQARATAKYLAQKNGSVCMDDVARLCPRPPEVSHNAAGAVFKGNGWECIGYQQSAQVSRKTGLQRIWRLA